MHAEVLKIALRAKRHDRFMLVSDAMPSVGADVKEFRIQGRPITVDGDKIVDDEGRLAGAHLDMASAVRNTVNQLGVPLADALRMASTQSGRVPEAGRQHRAHRAGSARESRARRRGAQRARDLDTTRLEERASSGLASARRHRRCRDSGIATISAP